MSEKSKLRARFFKSDDGRDLVEIAIVGDPCTFIGKVKPDHVAQFPAEWAAYQQGREEVPVDGTPLTEVPGLTANIAMAMKLKGVRTVEELAALDEIAAGSLGMGGMTMVKSARNMLAAQRLEALEAMQAERRGKSDKSKEA